MNTYIDRPHLFFVSVSLICIISLLLIGVVHAQPARASATSEDTYIVTLKDTDADPSAVENRLEKRLGHTLSHSYTYRHALSGFSARLSAEDAATLASDPNVESVIQDRPVEMLVERSALITVRGAERQSLSAFSQSLPTGINRIDAENKTNQGSGVEIAVIDTGIDLGHPDLAANIAGGKNCSTGSSYADGNGHGTHVAGTIAALENENGVVGVSPLAKLWSVRVLDNAGRGSWSSVICGLDFVTSQAPKNGGNITVANMSLGGSGSSDGNCGKTDGDPLHKAVCRARDAGVTVVVAAGNTGRLTNSLVPATYNDAVITVSALVDTNGSAGGGGPSTTYGKDDTFAKFSSYGYAVDLGAPGVNILSTYPGGRYATMSGTSMASPHVAGAVALYIAAHPGAQWLEVRDALKLAGEKLGAGHTDPSRKHPEPVLNVSTL